MKIIIADHDDTLKEIAERYQVPLDRLKQSNPHIFTPDKGLPGMKIRIPVQGKRVDVTGSQTGGTKKESLLDEESPFMKKIPYMAEDEKPAESPFPFPLDEKDGAKKTSFSDNDKATYQMDDIRKIRMGPLAGLRRYPSAGYMRPDKKTDNDCEDDPSQNNDQFPKEQSHPYPFGGNASSAHDSVSGFSSDYLNQAPLPLNNPPFPFGKG